MLIFLGDDLQLVYFCQNTLLPIAHFIQLGFRVEAWKDIGVEYFELQLLEASGFVAAFVPHVCRAHRKDSITLLRKVFDFVKQMPVRLVKDK